MTPYYGTGLILFMNKNHNDERMKRITILSGIIFGLILLSTVSENAFAQKKIDNPDITVGINGMSCPFCAYGVTKKLKKLDEIDIVFVSVDKGTADIKLKDNATLTEEKIVKAVKDAGFEVREIVYHNKAVKPERP